MTLSLRPLTATCDLCAAVVRLPDHGGDLRLALARWGWRVQPTGRVLCDRCDRCGQTTPQRAPLSGEGGVALA